MQNYARVMGKCIFNNLIVKLDNFIIIAMLRAFEHVIIHKCFPQRQPDLTLNEEDIVIWEYGL